MKYLRIACWVFVVIFVGVALSTLARPVRVVLPDISPHYLPGASRPDTLFCVIYTPPDGNYRYCELRHTIYIVLRDDTIYRTYQFIPGYALSAGELVLLWGEPERGYYNKDRTVMIWADRFAGIISSHGFSPRSRVSYLGYGECLYRGEAWAGWRDVR